MAIADFGSRRGRKSIAYVGAEPPQSFAQAVALLGYQVRPLDEHAIKRSEQLADIDSVIISQRAERAYAIRGDLARIARQLLDHDCRLYVRIARVEQLGRGARAIVVDALRDLKLPAGPLQPVEAAQMDPHSRDREGLPFAPFIYVCDSGVPWEQIAQWIADNPAGRAPSLNLAIDAFNANGEPFAFGLEEETLIRRAFFDCREIHLKQMADGLSGVRAFRAFALPAQGLLGPWPTVQFVKIGVRHKIVKEFENYEGNAMLYVPYHLTPRLTLRRCGLATAMGILVGDFVEDAEPLRDCASGGRAGAAIANLFNKTLRSWHHQSRVDETRSLPELVVGRWPQGIPKHREARIRSLGATEDLNSLRARMMLYASGPVRVGVTHGDLHATNVLVRGADAILIDFERLCEGALLCDAAALEGGLLVEGFMKDARPTETWLNSIAKLYEPPILEKAVTHDPRDPSAWFYACVRQVRLHARELECAPRQYEVALAVALISKACNPQFFGDSRDELRAAAYVLGEKLLLSSGAT
jgi:hypothetical protein